MARDARLGLAENRHELTDREFGFGEKGEQAQARGFAGRRRGRENGVERDVVGHGYLQAFVLANNMQIYLYVK